MRTISDALVHVVRADLGVAAGYEHVPKVVTPGEPVPNDEALFKWYDLHAAAAPIPAAIAGLARAAVAASMPDARGLGFVVLHRCGAGFYFLIACTWRNENELWATVWYKDGDAMTGFAPFPREGSHKPAFCVWELAPVCHEKDAWARFLRTARDERAAEAWLADQYAGPA